jgi:hypothetical protein
VKYRETPTSKLIDAYQKGMTLRQIAKLYSLHYTSVRERLLGAGVQMRQRGHYERRIHVTI